MEEKYKLKDWFEDQIKIIPNKYNPNQKHFAPHACKVANDEVIMLFCGFELILNSDGTYILSDTTGG